MATNPARVVLELSLYLVPGPGSYMPSIEWFPSTLRPYLKKLDDWNTDMSQNRSPGLSRAATGLL